jgi:hypothetical protein
MKGFGTKLKRLKREKTPKIVREIQLTLPEELTREQQINLTREFVRKSYVDHGVVTDICVLKYRCVMAHPLSSIQGQSWRYRR